MRQLLLSSLSPFARKVRVTLLEKGVEFESVEIERADQREWLRERSPRGEVPVLIDGGVTIAGSREICDYLEARCPEPCLVPADPAARARAVELERLADTETDALQFLTHLVRVRRPELGARYPALAGELERATERHFAHLAGELGAATHFAGELSRADVALFVQLSTLVTLRGRDLRAWPALAAWFARMFARDSVARDAREARAAYARAASDRTPFFASDSIHWRDTRIEAALRFGMGDWLVEELRAGRAFLSPAESF